MEAINLCFSFHQHFYQAPALQVSSFVFKNLLWFFSTNSFTQPPNNHSQCPQCDWVRGTSVFNEIPNWFLSCSERSGQREVTTSAGSHVRFATTTVRWVFIQHRYELHTIHHLRLLLWIIFFCWTLKHSPDDLQEFILCRTLELNLKQVLWTGWSWKLIS